jgi:uroporphyrinogen decarboxylase
MMVMTSRQRMINTLTWQPVDRPPHFEHMFELEQEAFGLSFPSREVWSAIGGDEKARLIDQCMAVYARIIEEYHWDALPVYWPWSDPDGVTAAKRHFGDRVLIGAIVNKVLWSIDTIDDWEQFAMDLYESPEKLHTIAKLRCEQKLKHIDRLVDAGAEWISIVDDVASNGGPFCSVEHFDQIVTPYLHRLVERIKQRGAFCTVHSDGNLMPVLDSILSTQPSMLHSIDPMAGMDIATVRQRTNGKVALMGNVRCDALQHGTPEEIQASAHYCLDACGHDTGYVFSSSNTIFQGMPLENYHCMLDVYRRFCDSEFQSDPTAGVVPSTHH